LPEAMSYLAERIIQFYEDVDGFYEWLKRFERVGVLRKVERDGSLIKISGKVNTGLSLKADPINNLVCLAFAFFGEVWPFLPDTKLAFKKIKRWWKDQIKQKRR